MGEGLYNPSNGTLPGKGIVVAIGLMAVFTLINLVGIRWVDRANTGLTIMKVVLPLLAVVVLVSTHFHPGNFTAGGGFFRRAEHSEDTHDGDPRRGHRVRVHRLRAGDADRRREPQPPARDLPWAVIGSVLIAVIIYILVQFRVHRRPEPGDDCPFPHVGQPRRRWSARGFAVLHVGLGRRVSPGWPGSSASVLSCRLAVAASYITTTSRISYGMSLDGYLPKAFEQTSERTKIPVFSVIVAFVLGCLFLLPFPSWGKLVSVVTSATVLMYVGAPLALGALRKNSADLHRSYRLPAAGFLAPVAFVFSTLIVYWAGWQTYSTLMVAVVIGYALMANLAYFFGLNDKAPRIEWASAKWLFPYLIGLGVISYFGGFGQGGIIGGVSSLKNVLVGGNADLPLYWDVLVVTIFSLAIYYLAMASRLSAEKVSEYTRGIWV